MPEQYRPPAPVAFRFSIEVSLRTYLLSPHSEGVSPRLFDAAGACQEGNCTGRPDPLSGGCAQHPLLNQRTWRRNRTAATYWLLPVTAAREVQNCWPASLSLLGFRVFVGNRVVIHLGDAQPNRANFDKLLASQPPDVALVPFWWILDEQGLAFLTHRWKPRQVVAFHFGAADTAKSAGKVRATWPGAWLCTKPGDSRAY